MKEERENELERMTGIWIKEKVGKWNWREKLDKWQGKGLVKRVGIICVPLRRLIQSPGLCTHSVAHER